MPWKCGCGRMIGDKQAWCFACGDPNPQMENAEDARAILAEGSLRLSQTYGVMLQLCRHGGMANMSPEEARELVAEAERDLLANLDEYRYA